MQRRQGEDRLYTAILMAFGVSLVVVGLLGVPALLVAAVGAVVAAIGIVVFRRLLERAARRGGHRPVPAKYVPSVLEGSSMRRRRGVHLRRHRHATPPLRFR